MSGDHPPNPPAATPPGTNGFNPASLSGDLAQFRVHDLCQLLGLAQSTGHLYLRAPGVHGVIEVDQGAVVGAAMRPNPTRLGRILRDSGHVSEAALALALGEQMAGDPRVLGAILAAGTEVGREQIARALREQQRAALSALLVLPAGRFAFKPGPVAEPAGRSFDFESLLFQALTRLDELDPARIPPE